MSHVVGQAGAVYVFTRLPETEGVGRRCQQDQEGELAGTWHGAERFKVQAHDAVAADRFGSAVSYLVRVEIVYIDMMSWGLAERGEGRA